MAAKPSSSAALCLVIGGAILLVALQAICIVQNL